MDTPMVSTFYALTKLKSPTGIIYDDGHVIVHVARRFFKRKIGHNIQRRQAHYRKFA
jgi:hypothetical protein